MNNISETPMMSKNEYEKIESMLDLNDIMLEYGAGSSTLYFSKKVKKYISIEHDLNWYNELKNVISENVNLYHGECFYLNNNVHCDYDSIEEKEKWRPYFEKIHNIPINKYDKILIDGRARAYCAKEVYNYLKDDGILFIHDYGRIKYHNIVEEKYKLINLTGCLGVFTKKIL